MILENNRIHLSRRHRDTEYYKKGFTFFEILLVLFIIGLLSAIAVPRLSGHTREIEVEEALKGIVNLAQYARITAINQQKSVSIVLDTDGKKAWIAYSPDGTEKILETLYGEKILFPDEIKVRLRKNEKLNNRLQFLPDGKVEYGYFEVWEEEQHKYTIERKSLYKGWEIIPLTETR